MTYGYAYLAALAVLIAEALRDTDSIGLTFGSVGGRGHGVCASQQARFTLSEFTINPGT